MIKFLDLRKINKPYETAFQKKLKTVLDKGWYILGDEVTAFENSFADYCGMKHCIGVGNGFDALVLIFKGYIQLGKLQKGDEVIVPANTYIASILAIVKADLIPVLVEPNLTTYNIDTALIEAKITSKVKAILAVHLYGQLADMDSLAIIANKYDLIVVEDAAQSHGALHNEPLTANYSQFAKAYSFYPAKNLGALGDGGAITTNNRELAELIKVLRNYGSKIKYENEYVGVNSRLDELQASFLNCKLPNLNQENQKRRAIAKRYLSEIKNEKIKLPYWDFSNNHVFHLFVIRTQERKKLQEYLYKNLIETVIHYPIPPHQQKAFLNWNTLSYPITEQIHNEVLSLPISPVLTDDEVSYVIQILNTY